MDNKRSIERTAVCRREEITNDRTIEENKSTTKRDLKNQNVNGDRLMLNPMKKSQAIKLEMYTCRFLTIVLELLTSFMPMMLRSMIRMPMINITTAYRPYMDGVLSASSSKLEFKKNG